MTDHKRTADSVSAGRSDVAPEEHKVDSRPEGEVDDGSPVLGVVVDVPLDKLGGDAAAVVNVAGEVELDAVDVCHTSSIDTTNANRKENRRAHVDSGGVPFAYGTKNGALHWKCRCEVTWGDPYKDLHDNGTPGCWACSTLRPTNDAQVAKHSVSDARPGNAKPAITPGRRYWVDVNCPWDQSGKQVLVIEPPDERGDVLVEVTATRTRTLVGRSWLTPVDEPTEARTNDAPVDSLCAWCRKPMSAEHSMMSCVGEIQSGTVADEVLKMVHAFGDAGRKGMVVALAHKVRRLEEAHAPRPQDAPVEEVRYYPNAFIRDGLKSRCEIVTPVDHGGVMVVVKTWSRARAEQLLPVIQGAQRVDNAKGVPSNVEIANRLDAMVIEAGAWLSHHKNALVRMLSERDSDYPSVVVDALRKLGECTLCNGKGEYLPSCFRCDDSTDDHECPGWEPCDKCERTGLAKEARDALAAIGAPCIANLEGGT